MQLHTRFDTPAVPRLLRLCWLRAAWPPEPGMKEKSAQCSFLRLSLGRFEITLLQQSHCHGSPRHPLTGRFVAARAVSGGRESAAVAQAAFGSFACELDARADVELGQDVRDMGLDGVWGEEHALRDATVRQSHGYEFRDSDLRVRKRTPTKLWPSPPAMSALSYPKPP